MCKSGNKANENSKSPSNGGRQGKGKGTCEGKVSNSVSIESRKECKSPGALTLLVVSSKLREQQGFGRASDEQKKKISLACLGDCVAKTTANSVKTHPTQQPCGQNNSKGRNPRGQTSHRCRHYHHSGCAHPWRGLVA